MGTDMTDNIPHINLASNNCDSQVAFVSSSSTFFSNRFCGRSSYYGLCRMLSGNLNACFIPPKSLAICSSLWDNQKRSLRRG
jgi:hypothetical protein